MRNFDNICIALFRRGCQISIISICGIQESRWKGHSARIISGKNSRYKFFWSGDDTGYGGVGILLEEALIENVISVEPQAEPQAGLPDTEKDKFYNDLLAQTVIIPAEETLLICGDLNGHVGEDTAGFDNVHGGNGFGDRNADGVRLLDFCLAANLSTV